MRLRPFLLSFLVTALLATPMLLNARSKARIRPAMVPAPIFAGPAILVDGVTFTAEIVESGEGYANVRVKARNTSAKAVTAALAVGVAREAPGARMARIMMPPEHLASQPVNVHLEAGETYESLVSILSSKIAKPAKPSQNGANLDAALVGMAPQVFATVANNTAMVRK